jgi:hypothetical protein
MVNRPAHRRAHLLGKTCANPLVQEHQFPVDRARQAALTALNQVAQFCEKLVAVPNDFGLRTFSLARATGSWGVGFALALAFIRDAGTERNFEGIMCTALTGG